MMSEGPALHFTASFMSGVVAQTVTQPVDTLKTLVMANGERTAAGRGRRFGSSWRGRARSGCTAGTGPRWRGKGRSW